MADEGVFPKIDGDVLYASETNTFNNAYKIGGFLGGETSVAVNSGASPQTVGSIVIPVGSITDPYNINFFGKTSANYSYPVFMISGTTANTTIYGGAAGGGVNDSPVLVGNFIGGSSFGCFGVGIGIVQSRADGGIYHDAKGISNLGTDVPIVVFAQISTEVDGPNMSWCVTKS